MQLRPARNFVAGPVSSIATLHVDPEQSDPRPDTNPSPNANPIPSGGSKSAGGSHAAPPRVLAAFFQKYCRAAERTALTNKTPHPAQFLVQDAAAHTHTVGRVCRGMISEHWWWGGGGLYGSDKTGVPYAVNASCGRPS